MRERGFSIETASVNSIHPPVGGFPDDEMREAARTFYIKETPKLTILKVLLGTLLRRPEVIVRGLRASLGLRPWEMTGMGYALFYLVEAILLGDWMIRRGCTHLHVHFGGSVATVGMLTSMAWEIPYSLTVHGPEEFYDVGPSFLEKKLLQAKFVTCISHFCRSQLCKIAPFASWGKFEVCRLGVRTDVFTPAAKGKRDALHIVSVGRLHPAKGQMILLGAFRQLLQQGLRVHLSIVGDGDGRGSLEDFIKAQGMGASVTLHGALSHPATRGLLGTADLFVLPSFAEGVPVALMEAMAMEVACISTFVAGIPELIETGRQGLLVPPSSQSELAAAMSALILEPARRIELAAAGRSKVHSSYDLHTNINTFIGVFEKYGIGCADRREGLSAPSRFQ